MISFLVSLVSALQLASAQTRITHAPQDIVKPDKARFFDHFRTHNPYDSLIDPLAEEKAIWHMVATNLVLCEVSSKLAKNLCDQFAASPILSDQKINGFQGFPLRNEYLLTSVAALKSIVTGSILSLPESGREKAKEFLVSLGLAEARWKRDNTVVPSDLIDVLKFGEDFVAEISQEASLRPYLPFLKALRIWLENPGKAEFWRLRIPITKLVYGMGCGYSRFHGRIQCYSDNGLGPLVALLGEDRFSSTSTFGGYAVIAPEVKWDILTLPDSQVLCLSVHENSSIRGSAARYVCVGKDLHLEAGLGKYFHCRGQGPIPIVKNEFELDPNTSLRAHSKVETTCTDRGIRRVMLFDKNGEFFKVIDPEPSELLRRNEEIKKMLAQPISIPRDVKAYKIGDGICYLPTHQRDLVCRDPEGKSIDLKQIPTKNLRGLHVSNNILCVSEQSGNYRCRDMKSGVTYSLPPGQLEFSGAPYSIRKGDWKIEISYAESVEPVSKVATIRTSSIPYSGSWPVFQIRLPRLSVSEEPTLCQLDKGIVTCRLGTEKIVRNHLFSSMKAVSNLIQAGGSICALTEKEIVCAKWNETFFTPASSPLETRRPLPENLKNQIIDPASDRHLCTRSKYGFWCAGISSSEDDLIYHNGADEFVGLSAGSEFCFNTKNTFQCWPLKIPGGHSKHFYLTKQ